MERVNMKKIREKRKKVIEEHGFSIEYAGNVYGVEGMDQTFPSIHTYGLVENFNHLNLELVLPVEPKMAGYVIHQIVDEIKSGATFEAGGFFQLEMLNNIPFTFIEVRSVLTKDKMLRILLPDKESRLPDDEGCNEVYDLQNKLGDVLGVSCHSEFIM